MSQPEQGAASTAGAQVDTNPIRPYSLRRIRTGLGVTLFGLFIFLTGARPNILGMDRSPIMGFIQIAVIEVGMAMICLGGYVSLMALWKNRQRSITADFGLRFVATGYVICFFTGMADILGLGSHPLPGIPYFGVWQAFGTLLGEAIIALGFLMLLPYPVHKHSTDHA
ncbi:MAG TPA: hypothetical protein VN376_09825 [Longilinea sp.]|nr:hypothetical protein [Longilinea sp.]